MNASGTIYNSIEEELWRIFTFYALHSDPTMPEIMKPANFIKFCKDCQITSKRFTSSAVELEMTRQARMKGTDYTPSSTVNFMDFMELLEILSVKVYPRDPPADAAKKLILENVLLLAHRRTPTTSLYDLDNPEALKVVTELYAHPLKTIFAYYLEKAGQRRADAVSLEKMKQRQILRQHGMEETDKAAVAMTISPFRQQCLQYLMGLTKTQKEMISYKEYLQFAHDFGLKAVNLLTATQIGEIFLSIVPLQTSSHSDNTKHRDSDSAGEGMMVAGMGFEQFCRSILFMALVAHRTLNVPTVFRVKALLLHMWKMSNDGGRTLSVLSRDRTHTLNSLSGHLNLFGSTDFSAEFKLNWQKEGYPDYTLPPQLEELTGTTMLRRVVGEVDTPRNRTSSSSSVDEAPIAHTPPTHTPHTPHTPNTNSPHNPHSSTPHPTWGFSNQNWAFSLATEETPEARSRPQYPVDISAQDLQTLVARRPELLEHLHLQVRHMKIQTERLTIDHL